MQNTLQISDDPKHAGQQIAKAFQWSGDLITIAFIEALTDANFHALARDVEKLAILGGMINEA